MAHVALDPSDAAAHALELPDAALQRLGAVRAEGDMAHARQLRLGEFQRVKFVIVPAAQIDRATLAAAFGEAEDVDEEMQAFLGLRGENLDVAEMGEFIGAFGAHGVTLGDSFACC